MKSKALILTMFVALAMQAPSYACGKDKKKEVSKNNQKQSRSIKQKRERRKKKLTQRLKRIKRRLVALEKKENS